ncbi:MAG: fibronectin type III domain-containing protein [Acidobacteria bacterium]|nr:fibronectin type III domain-containing protein [Acidobacteriota bacterium]
MRGSRTGARRTGRAAAALVTVGIVASAVLAVGPTAVVRAVDSAMPTDWSVTCTGTTITVTPGATNPLGTGSAPTLDLFRTDAGLPVDVTAATPLSVALDNSKVTAALPDVAAGTWSVVLTVDPAGAADTYTGTDVLTVYETRAGVATCVAPPTFVPDPVAIRAFRLLGLVWWARPASPATQSIVGYEVQRSADGTTWVTVASLIGLRGRVTVPLATATTHQYRVAAVNSSNVRGPWSTPATGLTLVAAPSAPRDVQALGTVTSMQLSWNAPLTDGGADVTRYRIQRSSDGVNWLNVKSVRGNITSTALSRVQQGRTYLFRVAAVNEKGQSLWSTPVAGTRP